MVSLKYQFVFLAFVATASAVSARTLDRDGFIREANGSIARMTHSDAMSACPEGTRLPTIRELLMESQRNGAKGILENAQVNSNRIPVGYIKISAINPNGQRDEFYFSRGGYPQRSRGDVDNYWSQSLDPEFFNHPFGNVAFGLYVVHGGSYSDSIHAYYGVRCVPVRQ